MAKQTWKPGNMLYPVPVVMVSCQDEQQKPNIITVAWAGTINTNPPMVSISVRPERHSYEMIKNSGEFVINLVTKKIIRETDFCGVHSGKDIDKFEVTHLTPLPSKMVMAPGIAESPVNLECCVKEIKALGSHSMFIAEVVNVTIEDICLKENGQFNLNQ